jgi:hypothetical protein
LVAVHDRGISTNFNGGADCGLIISSSHFDFSFTYLYYFIILSYKIILCKYYFNILYYSTIYHSKANRF